MLSKVDLLLGILIVLSQFLNPVESQAQSLGNNRTFSSQPSSDQHEGRRGPPQAALDACNDKNEEAACEFEGHRGKVQGTCQTRRNRLVCIPQRGNAQTERQERPKKRPSGPPQAALDACQNKKVGDSCGFEGRRGNKMSGVCQTHKDNTLSCMPNRQ